MIRAPPACCPDIIVQDDKSESEENDGKVREDEDKLSEDSVSHSESKDKKTFRCDKLPSLGFADYDRDSPAYVAMLVGQDRLALQSMGRISAEEPAVADQKQAVLACFGGCADDMGILGT
eukprot:s1017_g4.t1